MYLPQFTVYDQGRSEASEAGTPELGAGGAASPIALYMQEGQGGGAKVPFQFKGLPWRNSELSEMLVRIAQSPGGEPPHTLIIQ